MADAANAANDVIQGGVGEVGRGVMKKFIKASSADTAARSSTSAGPIATIRQI